MPLLFLLALFIVVPIVEIYLIIQVGQAIGALPTIAILIADSILGSLLMRSQGRRAWLRFQAALAEGRVPAREVVDGVLVVFGGAFLVTPGFASDAVGLLLLLPPTRALIRRVIVRRVTFGMLGGGGGRGGRGGGGGGFGGFGRGGPRPPGAGTSYDVEGHATEVDPRQLP
jgi:UPF0716 protein FxsA